MNEHPLFDSLCKFFTDLDKITVDGYYKNFDGLIKVIVFSSYVTNFKLKKDKINSFYKKYKDLIRDVDIRVINDELWLTITQYPHEKMLKNLRKRKIKMVYGQY